MESATESPRRLALVTLTALGVVYGDIGTSPLYALKEAFGESHAIAATEANIFGVLSLVLWWLVLVVVIKYLTFVLSADNNGEGGILALLALLTEDFGQGFYRAVAYYGFMETPDIQELLKQCFAFEPRLPFPPLDTTYMLARDTILVTSRPGMARWRKHLFAFLARNNARATAFFNIPPNRVLELGAQVEL